MDGWKQMLYNSFVYWYSSIVYSVTHGFPLSFNNKLEMLHLLLFSWLLLRAMGTYYYYTELGMYRSRLLVHYNCNFWAFWQEKMRWSCGTERSKTMISASLDIRRTQVKPPPHTHTGQVGLGKVTHHMAKLLSIPAGETPTPPGKHTIQSHPPELAIYLLQPSVTWVSPWTGPITRILSS